MSFIIIEKPHVGDLLRVGRDAGYFHFGIAVTPDRVVHFTGTKADMGLKDDTIGIYETPLSEFVRGGVLEAENTSKSPFFPEEIVDRARKYVGSKTFRNMEYNVVTNNCEHFARYVYSGKAISYQVRKGALGAGLVLGATAVVVAGDFTVRTVKKVVNKIKTGGAK